MDSKNAADSPGNASLSKEAVSQKIKTRNPPRKRARISSDSSFEELPENTLEIEKNLQAAALKNNLDDISVKKILKKVVTNDHVLALVKLREEEESSNEEPKVRPKLTRAKAKELMKVSPKSNVAWNLENLALTPIKHIPVKTRPEVEALIAQELPDDEDDEEYKPNHDEAASDEDHTESDVTFSDLDSQPRTPATPVQPSPGAKQGPFKVPQDIKTPARRLFREKDEDATIALRTRSKLSLSSTPIEHIESSFVPPDALPLPELDDLWTQFLEEIMDPAATSKPEDDDEADMDYNVAADPDAQDDDEDALESSIRKISQKELNDLVTELFHIMPENIDGKNIENATEAKQCGKDITISGSDINGTSNNIAGNPNAGNEPTKGNEFDKVTFHVAHWDGKREPMSDDETPGPARCKERSFSIGKTEVMDEDEDEEEDPLEIDESVNNNDNSEVNNKEDAGEKEINNIAIEAKEKNAVRKIKNNKSKKWGIRKKKKVLKPSKNMVEVQFQQTDNTSRKGLNKSNLPPILKRVLPVRAKKRRVEIVRYDEPVKMLPEQVQILQQQLRQHIQIAASNFLQLYVHPENWALAPTYKEYLETLNNMSPESVVHVCNLESAVQLVHSWEEAVSANTPENVQMVQFLQNELEKCRRRNQMNSYYMGEFHETFKKVVANSSVFLYPHLLPPAPYRKDSVRRIAYRKSEDELIALGLDQFSCFIEENPDLFKKQCKFGRPELQNGLNAIAHLICKLMLPCIDQKRMVSHIRRIKNGDDTDNPIYKFFHDNEIAPVKHVLLPYNENINLYQQPEHEMPLLWVRYIAQTSKRARDYLKHRKFQISQGDGVPVEVDVGATTTPKRANSIAVEKKTPRPPKFDKNVSWTSLAPIPIAPRNSGNVAKNLNGITPNVESVKSTATTTAANTETVPSSTDSPTVATKTSVTVTSDNNKNVQSQPVTQVPAGALHAGFYTIVQKKNVAMLVPLNVTSNTVTVNTAMQPITTPVVSEGKGTEPTPSTSTTDKTNAAAKTEIKPNEPRKSQIKEKRKNNSKIDYLPHCQCCAVIKKISKLKQKHITDYFKMNAKVGDKCPCNSVELPKITHRLWLLATSFHSHFSRVWREVNIKTEALAAAVGHTPYIQKHKNDNNEYIKANDVHFSDLDSKEKFDDLVLATSYYSKIISKVVVNRLKVRVIQLFSSFNPIVDNPVALATDLYKCLENRHIDLHKDFAAFLTGEQAERVGCFRDYFLQNHMTKLLTRVDKQIEDKHIKYKITQIINKLLTENTNSSCDICYDLLPHFKDYPKLAEYVFFLFPHRTKMRKPQKEPEKACSEPSVINQTTLAEKTNETSNIEPSNQNGLGENAVVGYEADHSFNDGDGSNNLILDTTKLPSESQPAKPTDRDDGGNDARSAPTDKDIQMEQNVDAVTIVNEIKHEITDEVMDTVELTISKTEIQEYDSDSSRLHLVMSEDESVKSEPTEWTKDEDKIILQMLKKQFTTDVRRDLETVFENFEENGVFQTISEAMPQKSVQQIRDRISYVLDLIIMVENDGT